jgi:hypothetical protein
MGSIHIEYLDTFSELNDCAMLIVTKLTYNK